MLKFKVRKVRRILKIHLIRKICKFFIFSFAVIWKFFKTYNRRIPDSLRFQGASSGSWGSGPCTGSSLGSKSGSSSDSLASSHSTLKGQKNRINLCIRLEYPGAITNHHGQDPFLSGRNSHIQMQLWRLLAVIDSERPLRLPWKENEWSRKHLKNIRKNAFNKKN